MVRRVKKQEPDASQKNIDNIMRNGREARRLYNKTWNVAARAPIFCKITKAPNPEAVERGRPLPDIKKYRTARLINSHAFTIAASGAGLHASRVLANDCDVLRFAAVRENARAPWTPTISKGARMVIEQFLCALAQEAATKAHFIRKGASSSQRLNKQHMCLAWEATLESVFGGTNLIAQDVVHTPSVKGGLNSAKRSKSSRKGKSSKTGEDEDYEGPGETEGSN